MPPTLRWLGVHPLAAVALVVIDVMLFSVDVVSLGLGMALTIPVGILVGLLASLAQKYGYRDHWGLAIAKGVFLGVITAIPTPIPALLTAGTGVAGLLGTRRLRALPPKPSGQHEPSGQGGGG
jgi:hypothetical protein